MLDFKNSKKIGNITSVDTGNVIIKIHDENDLNRLQVNHLVAIRSTKVGQSIIGLVNKIMRKSQNMIEEDDPDKLIVEDIIKVNLVGTFMDKSGEKENVFKRTLETVPSINADCFALIGDVLSVFMNSLSSESDNKDESLYLGEYTLEEGAKAYLDGNKFFQRHAVIVGSTGSGKSYTVANVLEKAAKLKSTNSIVFDIHGEYSPLQELNNTRLLKIAGPNEEENKENIIFLPYWLLSYDEIDTMILDRSDQNAPNQARALFDAIVKYKKDFLNTQQEPDYLENFTIDSPIPCNLNDVLQDIRSKDEEMIPGARKDLVKGPLHGKFTRFIQRLESKQSDKRLNFIFNQNESLLSLDFFNSLVHKLMDFGEQDGLKIIDFSEVPSDILPLATSLVAKIVFSIQQWSEQEKRHPIALFCDEAHLYMPEKHAEGIEGKSVSTFERIAKEGRKYGVALVVISQRPSDVCRTVMSQCNNFISMRLSNPDDQNAIRRLFPDYLQNLADILPILDIGEALVVGDSCLLPSRIRISEPNIKPNSATIDFWDEWKKENKENILDTACEALIKQKK